ncbi:FUSC family protein, partial [Acidisphaera sp. S103]|uniref:FUSC family protein n=1 Tax=Acidisphaera sp. S103 TaxID=1747223 RepID=UPI00131B2B99
GVRLWAAVCLALFVAFSLELDDPYWAGATAAVVFQPVLGASLRKAWFRLIGTVIGATAAVLLSAAFPQNRACFLLGLALWGGVCALGATLLRNFASYGASLAGYSAAIIIGSELGAVGGVNGDAFNLAVTRGTEIGIGIVCACVLLAVTDLGSAQRRLAALLTSLSTDIADGLVRALRLTGSAQADARPLRRQMIGRVATLDVVIDQASAEIAASPFHPDALRAAASSLFVALAAWRSVANHLEFAPGAASDAARVRDYLPPALDNPAALWATARRLVALPAETPSLRLLCDRTAGGLLALGRTVRPRKPRQVAWPSVPDILPALINAVRAFLTIGAAALVWIWTAWPSGATFIIFTTIGITLFAPREDTAYATAKTFTTGTACAAVCAAVAAFALLPQQSGFAGFCVVLGLVLIPAGALSSRSWHPPMFVALGANFIALLRPSNPAFYDPEQYYNSAMALFGGVAFAMLAMRLLPPMPPAMRMRRLLALTLRDLRRLTHARLPRSSVRWERRIHGRLRAIPVSVDTLQAARLMAALSAGSEIIRLRRIALRFHIGSVLQPAMTAIAAGNSDAALRSLDRFDDALARLPAELPGTRLRLRARGTIRSIADSFARHTEFFDARVR